MDGQLERKKIGCRNDISFVLARVKLKWRKHKYTGYFVLCGAPFISDKRSENKFIRCRGSSITVDREKERYREYRVQ